MVVKERNQVGLKKMNVKVKNRASLGEIVEELALLILLGRSNKKGATVASSPSAATRLGTRPPPPCLGSVLTLA